MRKYVLISRKKEKDRENVCLQGFYTVYRRVFEAIVAEDLEFIEDPASAHFPGFGTSDSDYEEVLSFSKEEMWNSSESIWNGFRSWVHSTLIGRVT